MITHLTAREWAEVLGIAAGIFVAGGLVSYASQWLDTWDEFNAGPDQWPGWEGTKPKSQSQTPQDGRDGRGGGE